MLVTVEAHHSKGEFFRDAICGVGKVLDLSVTHCLIGKTTYQVDETVDDADICEMAFATFNWMTKNRAGLAPYEINEMAKQFDSHASMSVGDIVVIHRAATISIWKCKPYCWERIMSFRSNIAGTPEV